MRRDPVVRRLLALPVPLPSAVMPTVVGTVYVRLAFSGPGAADPALVASFAGHHAGRSQVARLLASGRRLLPELQEPPADLGAIACPVLLVWGTRDRMVPHTAARVLLEALEGTEVALLEGVGHCPQLEATGRLARLLLEFQASSSPPHGRPS